MIMYLRYSIRMHAYTHTSITLLGIIGITKIITKEIFKHCTSSKKVDR